MVERLINESSDASDTASSLSSVENEADDTNSTKKRKKRRHSKIKRKAKKWRRKEKQRERRRKQDLKLKLTKRKDKDRQRAKDIKSRTRDKKRRLAEKNRRSRDNTRILANKRPTRESNKVNQSTFAQIAKAMASNIAGQATLQSAAIKLQDSEIRAREDKECYKSATKSMTDLQLMVMKLWFALMSALTTNSPVNTADLQFTPIHKKLIRRTGSVMLNNQIMSLTKGWECCINLDI